MDQSRRDLLKGAASAGLLAGLPAVASGAGEATREFAGKTAFVTGGARGIGLATAEALAAAGANIVLYDVCAPIEHVKYPLATPQDLAGAKKTVEALGVKCHAVQGDVRDGAKQSESMSRAVSELGSLDFVIANAGITQLGPLDRLSDDEVDVVLDVNLAGSIKTVRAAIPHLQKRGSGRIVLMSSITGRRGSALFPVYAASKWGLIGLAKSTAQQLGKSGVTCNAVCPSLVHTKLLDNEYILKGLIPQAPTIEAAQAGAKQQHVLDVGLFGPEHVANAVKFLCSEAADYISGEVFDIAAGANANFNA